MDCRQVHQAYSVFLQGKLSPQQAQWVSEHIHNCPDCFLLDQKIRKAFVEEKTGVGAGAAKDFGASVPTDGPSRSTFKPQDRENWLS